MHSASTEEHAYTHNFKEYCIKVIQYFDSCFYFKQVHTISLFRVPAGTVPPTRIGGVKNKTSGLVVVIGDSTENTSSSIAHTNKIRKVVSV